MQVFGPIGITKKRRPSSAKNVSTRRLEVSRFTMRWMPFEKTWRFTVVTPEDRRFVLENVTKRLKLAEPLTEADIIAERCGVRPLAVFNAGNGNGSSGRDWMQLSRKHAIDVNVDDAHVSIFGGKLTDCLNVGEEICATLQRLGLVLRFGEPAPAVRDEYFHQARLMNLDAMTSPLSSEKLSTRLWRRYGAEALALLETIRRDPSMAEVLIEGSEYLRCEIDQAERREMVVKLEDFLRRRSKISLVVRRDEIQRAAGLREACRIFFGDEADAKIAEYFGESSARRTA
jgi:glycerol-3-phosphate dehydrogenase